MSEINDKWLDDYFEKRPQLTPPTKGRFGYKIPKQWFDAVHSLLQIVNSTELSDTPGTIVCECCDKTYPRHLGKDCPYCGF